MSAGRLLSRYRVPHVAGLPSQAREAERAIMRLTQDANERAVLRVVIAHADGAGVCFVKVERITHLAGIGSKRTVQRTLARLRANGLLEVVSSKRDPKRYVPSLPIRARQGSGPNWYRLGAAVRAAAGYREVDMAATYRGAAAPPQIDSVSPPGSASVTPATAPSSDRSIVTSDEKGVSSPGEQALSPPESEVRVTPRTENGKPLIPEQRLGQSRGEGTVGSDAPRIAADGSLEWHGKPRPGELLGVLADAQALVDAELATWVGERQPLPHLSPYVPADRIRAVIERMWTRRGRSLAELARRSGVTARTIEGLMRGERIAARFGVADSIITAIDVGLWCTPREEGGLADLYGLELTDSESYDPRNEIAPATRERPGARHQGGTP